MKESCTLEAERETPSRVRSHARRIGRGDCRLRVFPDRCSDGTRNVPWTAARFSDYHQIMVTPRTRTRERSPREKQKHFSLYWCTTDDGDEDWFVVADSAQAARRYHEHAEGYERGGATAERVARLPSELVRNEAWFDPETAKPNTRAGWPSDAMLRCCGGEVAMLPRELLRESMGVVCKVVRFGNRVYRAGDVVTNTLTRRGLRESARLAVFPGGK